MDDENENIRPAGTGSFFEMKRTWLIMIVIAIVAVFWGMGGQRTAREKTHEVYSAQDRHAKEADKTAGFGRLDDKNESANGF